MLAYIYLRNLWAECKVKQVKLLMVVSPHTFPKLFALVKFRKERAEERKAKKKQ